MKQDIVVIGGGPAGISCAIQLHRYNLDVVLIEKNKLGGLLSQAHLVENYLGFPEGISGKKLVDLFSKQFKSCNISVLKDEVTNIRYVDPVFYITTKEKTIRANICVVATGTLPKLLPIDTVKLSDPSLLHYNINRLCHVNNKHIIIIGAGDAAFDYGLQLSQKNKVTIVNRSTRLKCLPLLYQRMKKTSTISYFESYSLSRIYAHDQQTYAEFLHTETKESLVLQADSMLIAIGREPANDFLSDDLKQMKQNIQNKKKLYMIGDVHNTLYRQTSICVGEGIRCAMHIMKTHYGQKK